ncbi:MAG: response regulator transcription factor [Burkholderiales bacterium]|nr:response regulator transcription factor [Burkholderiales bacterium]
MRFLLVEDDPMIAAGLREALRRAGHAVDWTADAQVAAAAARTEPFDMLVLDLGLQRGDGLAVLRELRRRGDTTPVIVVTARDALQDKLAGLDAGADDYLVKPFAVEELLARIRTVARRRADLLVPEQLGAGPVRLDPGSRRAWVEEVEIHLSAREFSILEILVRARGAALSRPQIEQRLYGWDEQVESNAVEVHIHHLRRKLGAGVLQNVRGVGYRLRA